MARGLRRIQETLPSIDLILEVRDARLPLTSINPAFEKLFGRDRGFHAKPGKKRLVVYNKRDLAEPALERPIQRALLQHAGQLSIFTNSRDDHDVRRLLKIALKYAQSDFPDVASTRPNELRFLIAGMPNVGKSSILNALRRVGVNRGKAAQTGLQAGTTRKLTGTVRVWDGPPTYVFDTPGIMVPYLGSDAEAIEKGIKLALTAGLKESLYDLHTLADYLLYKLNLRYFHPAFPTRPEDLPVFLHPYIDILPTDDLELLLRAIGTRMGALRKGGKVDEEFAARLFITAFREGKLGLWALDDMGLLLTGDENTAQLNELAESTLALPLKNAATTAVLPSVELDNSLALLGSPTPLALIPDDSQTSLQISTFVASHFAQQNLALSILPTSKTQIRKRDRLRMTESRERKWREKHPELVKSGSIAGKGRTPRIAGRPFFVGGEKLRRRLEKKRSIARRVDRRRRKMK